MRIKGKTILSTEFPRLFRYNYTPCHTYDHIAVNFTGYRVKFGLFTIAETAARAILENVKPRRGTLLHIHRRSSNIGLP